jgi:hypothetical protein
MITEENYTNKFFNLGQELNYLGMLPVKPPQTHYIMLSEDGR